MKKLTYSIAVITAATIFFLRANDQREERLSDLVLANVEALAQNEEGGAVITCSQYCNDGIGKCWLKSVDDFCIFSGSQLDYCTGYGCKKYDGTIYY